MTWTAALLTSASFSVLIRAVRHELSCTETADAVINNGINTREPAKGSTTAGFIHVLTGGFPGLLTTFP